MYRRQKAAKHFIQPFLIENSTQIIVYMKESMAPVLFYFYFLKLHKHFLNTFSNLNIKKASAITEALVLVRMKGFEPPRRETHGPQPCASASSATSAYFLFPIYYPA